MTQKTIPNSIWFDKSDLNISPLPRDTTHCTLNILENWGVGGKLIGIIKYKLSVMLDHVIIGNQNEEVKPSVTC